ncbi:MAG: hypothetical protein U0790_04030 [Isosphaeraceae bacterium]
MGRDKSLSDDWPSVIINNVRYHYGREREYGQHLVENAFVARDYWCFHEEVDLRAFLTNLPESADRGLRLRLHPDWGDVTPERRDAYFERDKLLFRAWAEKKFEDGSAQQFDMDLEGRRGPHIPQRIAGAGRSPDAPHWVVGAWHGARPPYHGQWVRSAGDVLVPFVEAVRAPNPGARCQYVIAEVLDPAHGMAAVVGATKDREYLLRRREQYERGLVPVQTPPVKWQLDSHPETLNPGSEMNEYLKDKQGRPLTVRFNDEDHWVRVERYAEGDRPALLLVPKASPEGYIVVTANPERGQARGSGELLIKNYSENSGVLEALEAAGVVRRTGGKVQAGYSALDVVRALVEIPAASTQQDRTSGARRTADSEPGYEHLRTQEQRHERGRGRSR